MTDAKAPLNQKTAATDDKSAATDTTPKPSTVKCLWCSKPTSLANKLCGVPCREAFVKKQVEHFDAEIELLKATPSDLSKALWLRSTCRKTTFLLVHSKIELPCVAYGDRQILLADYNAAVTGMFDVGPETYIQGLPAFREPLVRTRNGFRRLVTGEQKRLTPPYVDEITSPLELVVMFTPRSIPNSGLVYILKTANAAARMYIASGCTNKAVEGTVMAGEVLYQMFMASAQFETAEEATENLVELLGEQGAKEARERFAAREELPAETAAAAAPVTAAAPAK